MLTGWPDNAVVGYAWTNMTPTSCRDGWVMLIDFDTLVRNMKLSLTVRVTLKLPGRLYMCWTVGAPFTAEKPSPKFQ